MVTVTEEHTRIIPMDNPKKAWIEANQAHMIAEAITKERTRACHTE
jgi:hypothetical protein